VKKIWRSVNICQSYGQKHRGPFFWLTVYITWSQIGHVKRVRVQNSNFLPAGRPFSICCFPFSFTMTHHSRFLNFSSFPWTRWIIVLESFKFLVWALQGNYGIKSLSAILNFSDLKSASFIRVHHIHCSLTTLNVTRQEAQLPLKNRASAMHFFVAKLLSIAVMTYSYVYHRRNLRPVNLLRTQRINFSMRPQHAADRWQACVVASTVVWSLLSREPLRIPA